MADELAREIGAGRGRLADIRQCELLPPPGARALPSCTMRGGVTVLAFARPTVTDGVALLRVFISHPDGARQVAGWEVELELARGANGQWAVRRMRKTAFT